MGMTADEEPLVLNTWRVWNDRVDSDAMAIVDRCRKFLDRLKARHRSDQSGLVAYDRLAADEEFQVFEEMTCEVQRVRLPTLDVATRTAFCTNLYNMMVTHAFAKVGRPEGSIRRDAFFSNVSYNIGGLTYSLSDLENGVLRGNTRPAGFHFSKPFGSADRRLPSALPSVDARIHFALNCGARSCPPIKSYSAANIHEELRVVALAFCEQDENVLVDVDQNTLTVSKIFQWYSVDFGSSTDSIVALIGGWLRGAKKAAWDSVVATGSYRFRKMEYDWTTDAVPSGKTFQGRPRGV